MHHSMDDRLFLKLFVSKISYIGTWKTTLKHFSRSPFFGKTTKRFYTGSTFHRILETLHVILLAISYYSYTVTNFGDYEVLAKADW